MRALDLVHDTIKKYIKPGDVCIDATMGRGYDTSYLSELVGEKGKILSFDIQQSAIDSTRQLLKDRGQVNCDLILDSHENMSKYAENDSVSCILFNLGYLPSGDHTIYTHAKSTIKAIEEGLKLLKKDGIMCVSIYYGGDSGYEERDELLPFLRNMDDSKYQVIMASFYNWKNDPPIPVFITKV